MKQFPFSDPPEFKIAPKIRIEELLEIEKNWNAIQAVFEKRLSPPPPALDTAQAEEPAPLVASPAAGDPDAYVASVGSDMRLRFEGANGWWQTFLETEKKYWLNKPPDMETGEFPTDQRFVDFPSALLASPQTRVGKRLIAALDDLSTDVSDILEDAEMANLVKLLKDTHTMERDLEGRPEAEDLLYLHSSGGTKPDTRVPYDPSTDLAVGHFAVVKVDVEDSSGSRGWDLVEINSDPVDGVLVQCVYLMPSYSNKEEALVYTDSHYPGWSSDWMDRKLVPITIGVRKKTTWLGDVPLDAVQFSCLPTATKKIAKKYHTSMLLACKAIEDNTATEAVQSDGENVDSAEEEEGQEDWDDDLEGAVWIGEEERQE